MPNILIRDLSQEAVDRIDAAAANLGLSRNEYLRRMAATSWLTDKSAYMRLQLDEAPNRDEWNTRSSRGLVRLSTITRLELPVLQIHEHLAGLEVTRVVSPCVRRPRCR